MGGPWQFWIDRGGTFTGIVGYDMGGTSTDVALCDGAYARSSETEIAGVGLRCRCSRPGRTRGRRRDRIETPGGGYGA
ncbi:hydantoinase/oxoprolinase family protein [Acidiphilium cryptum]|nr:hydantoinase/oxoprolinase family protein [Acidiphilium cryptum]